MRTSPGKTSPGKSSPGCEAGVGVVAQPPMPCPFFLPTHRLDCGAWVRPPRLPLGDPYAGVCHSDPSAPLEPPEAHQRELCNCGYARYRCAHFPEDAAADAVRFSVVEDTAGRIELVYVIEKNHAPAEHGRLVYVQDADRLEGPHTTGLLARQARAFLESRASHSFTGDDGAGQA